MILGFSHQMKFKRYNRISIPNSIAEKARRIKSKGAFYSWQITPDRILQGHLSNWILDKEDIEELIVNRGKFENPYNNKDKAVHPDILVFKEVSKHNDKDYLAGCCFVQIVLFGSFELCFNGESHKLKKGDVFAMDPNSYHWVKAKNLCCTICFTPRKKDHLLTKLQGHCLTPVPVLGTIHFIGSLLERQT